MELVDDAELHFRKLRIDLKDFYGYEIANVTHLMQMFDQIDEIFIQCRTEIVKEIYKTKKTWRWTELSTWGEFTALGKDRSYLTKAPSVYDEFEAFWQTVNTLGVKTIKFEHVVDLQDSENVYIDAMMHDLKENVLKRVNDGVEVLLAGEWIPDYDFNQKDAALLRE